MNYILQPDGTKTWHNSFGSLHRDNGPAKICLDGRKYWYKNGVQHREDGPAYEDEIGYKVYMQNGNNHRLDGPAFISPRPGKNAYYLCGHVFDNVKEWEWCVKNFEHLDIKVFTICIRDKKLQLEYDLRFG